MDTSFFSKFEVSLRKLSRKVTEIDVDKIFALAGEEIKSEIHNILLENLQNAIEQTEEFQYPELSQRLLEVFSREGMIGFRGRGVVIYAPSIAGDRYDWERVLIAAKAEYSDFALTPEKALEFWTERVYKPARDGGGVSINFPASIGFDYGAYGSKAYEKAIRTRLERTKNAPFWTWLENGIDASHYPNYGGTSFVAKTVIEGNVIYREELIKQAEEILNTVSSEIVEFFRNPGSYVPGQELDKIEGFRLAVTPVRQELGITQR